MTKFMIDFKSYSEDGSNYLALDIENKDDVDKIAYKALKWARPDFLIEIDPDKNKDTSITYKLPANSVSLEKYTGNLLIDDVLEMYNNTIFWLEECEDWFLKNTGFYFDAKYVYIDKETKKLSLAYIPLKSYQCKETDIKQFFISVLEKCDSSSGGDIQLRLYKYFYKPTFSISEIKEMLVEFAEMREKALYALEVVEQPQQRGTRFTSRPQTMQTDAAAPQFANGATASSFTGAGTSPFRREHTAQGAVQVPPVPPVPPVTPQSATQVPPVPPVPPVTPQGATQVPPVPPVPPVTPQGAAQVPPVPPVPPVTPQGTAQVVPEPPQGVQPGQQAQKPEGRTSFEARLRSGAARSQGGFASRLELAKGAEAQQNLSNPPTANQQTAVPKTEPQPEAGVQAVAQTTIRTQPVTPQPASKPEVKRTLEIETSEAEPKVVTPDFSHTSQPEKQPEKPKVVVHGALTEKPPQVKVNKKRNLFETMFSAQNKSGKEIAATQDSGHLATGSSVEPVLNRVKENSKYNLPRQIPLVFEDGVCTIGRHDESLGYQQSTIEFGPEIKPISKIHAKIEKRGDEYYLCDLGSGNGTYLNGSKIIAGKLYPLRQNDRIAFAIAFSENSIEYMFVK